MRDLAPPASLSDYFSQASPMRFIRERMFENEEGRGERAREVAPVVDAVFGVLHPTVATWCDVHLGTPTPPQAGAIPLALARRTTIICSPTGTGKTLAAFLPVMSRLAEKRAADELFARPFCLYVSPLRALGYDVEHNLRRPLREMGLLERPNTERAVKRRGRIREVFVRTGVRTGDTPVEERRLMLARPPHVLITTPESLALMLAMESYRKTLTAVETVVIDEVHALAGNKRGAQLSLLLESLEEIVPRPLHRVGLSATVAPLERVAAFVAGNGRDCAVVDCRGLRAIKLDIMAPFAGAMAPLGTAARAAFKLTEDVRTTLVFTNVRSQAERVAHEMEAAGEPAAEVDVIETVREKPARDRRIGVHHSALEKNVRHRVESQLRDGTLRTVVCSTSLELGVDIGFIDRVLILGGARGMTPTLQRVGRAGHRPGAVATGVIIAQDRDDIVEAAATRRSTCSRSGSSAASPTIAAGLSPMRWPPRAAPIPIATSEKPTCAVASPTCRAAARVRTKRTCGVSAPTPTRSTAWVAKRRRLFSKTSERSRTSGLSASSAEAGRKSGASTKPSPPVSKRVMCFCSTAAPSASERSVRAV
jgi:ATP-dependent Lhr-like helicase